MQPKTRHFSTGLLLGMAATLLVLLVVAVAFAYSGSYNVAASSGHTAGMRWWLDTAMHASVSAHADGTAVPTAGIDLAAGAGEYKSMCEHCHGGPGVEPAGWSRGLLPRPPHLVEEASEWRQEQVFWIVRHGIKYTAMPGFGETHDDATLWNIAAFVDQLPGMTPQQYGSAGAGHSHDDGAGHGNDMHGDAGRGDTDRRDADQRSTDQSSTDQRSTDHHSTGRDEQDPPEDAHPEHDH